MPPVLYCHADSGYSYKVGLALSGYDRRSRDDLDEMDQVLTHRPFLAGEDGTMADLACCGYLFFIGEGEPWAQAAGIDLASWPRVHDWLNRMGELRGFETPEVLFSGHPAIH